MTSYRPIDNYTNITNDFSLLSPLRIHIRRNKEFIRFFLRVDMLDAMHSYAVYYIRSVFTRGAFEELFLCSRSFVQVFVMFAVVSC